MHRFFVTPKTIAGGLVTFNEEQRHQIARVLRLAEGDHVVVLDDSGWEFDVELDRVSPGAVAGTVRAKRLPATEPQAKVTLYQALVKGPKFEYALQKATEVGAAALVPIISKRCVVGQVEEFKQTRVARWRRVVQEAAEQSGRAKIPIVGEPLLFTRACERVRGVAAIAWEGERARSLRGWLRDTPRPFSCALFIGPEGGFAGDEVEFAGRWGILPVSLGPRIVRAETAGVVALTAMFYEWGELEL